MRRCRSKSRVGKELVVDAVVGFCLSFWRVISYSSPHELQYKSKEREKRGDVDSRFLLPARRDRGVDALFYSILVFRCVEPGVAIPKSL